MTDESALDAVLATVRARTGLDFTAYRRPTIARRVRNRMLSAGKDTLADYLAHLRASPGETQALLQRLTIKVSRFYRDAAAFDLVGERVLPELAARAHGRPLRIWSAGCGNGEEPHTLAMLLERAGTPGEILATDIDPAALATAQAAIYPACAATELPAELAARFLAVEADGRRRVVDAARARIRWRLEDLAGGRTEAVPFDFVCCRNVLIYLDRDAQHRVLRALVDAVVPGGYLLLGEAEWPHQALLPSLTPLAHRQRLFQVHARTGRMAA